MVKLHPLSHPVPLRVHLDLVIHEPPIAIKTLRLEFDRLGEVRESMSCILPTETGSVENKNPPIPLHSKSAYAI